MNARRMRHADVHPDNLPTPNPFIIKLYRTFLQRCKMENNPFLFLSILGHIRAQFFFLSCCVGLMNDDAYSYLLPDKNRNSKQKTPVAKRSVNPVWNYTFAYDDVSLNELSERALELTIWDHDRLASNEFLGGVRFSLGTGKF